MKKKAEAWGGHVTSGSETQSPLGSGPRPPLKAKLFLLCPEGVGPFKRQFRELRDTRGWGLDLGWGPGPYPDDSRNPGLSWGLSICEMGVDAAFCLQALTGGRRPCSRSDNGALILVPRQGGREARTVTRAGSNLGGAPQAPLCAAVHYAFG